MVRRHPPSDGHGKISVFLVNDYALLRQGLAKLLREQPRIDVVGEASGCQEALARIRRVSPDVVLTDTCLPDGSGADLARALRVEMPQARVILLSMDNDDAQLLAAVRAGVKGMLDKTANTSNLVSSILEVAAGEVSISRNLATKLIVKFADTAERAPEKPQSVGGLTERELQILDQLSCGQTNRAIAQTLFVSESTVRAHLRSIMQKLNCSNRVQAAAYALRNGLSAPNGRPELGHNTYAKPV